MGLSAMLFTKTDRLALCLLVIYILMLLLMPIYLEGANFQYMLSEDGPFERLSILFWVLLALVILIRVRPLTHKTWIFILLSLMLAAREADWHKKFTVDSLLKTNYYRQAVAPLEEKIMAAMVALALIGMLLYAGVAIFRFLLKQQGWRSRTGIWLIIGTVLIVSGKFLDRAPAILLEDYGLVLSPLAGKYATSLEEGLEMVHPLILMWSAWISQKGRSYLS